mmetsp:Transcript_26945/g.63286  ORF Transcript_26945/g.63286 Transcript_26945/m.63286 type:complete len:142 (-) Transcript_26945:1534-1959(-)
MNEFLPPERCGAIMIEGNSCMMNHSSSMTGLCKGFSVSRSACSVDETASNSSLSSSSFSLSSALSSNSLIGNSENCGSFITTPLSVTSQLPPLSKDKSKFLTGGDEVQKKWSITVSQNVTAEDDRKNVIQSKKIYMAKFGG